MSDDRSNVIPLRVGESDLAAAWAAYDAAALHAAALYRDNCPDEKVRLRASLEALRLWKELQALFVRADASAVGRG